MALAQSYPARNITMIVPFLADGAGGMLGATRASEAAADGYTIFSASMVAIIAAPSFYPNLKYGR